MPEDLFVPLLLLEAGLALAGAMYFRKDLRRVTIALGVIFVLTLYIPAVYLAQFIYEPIFSFWKSFSPHSFEKYNLLFSFFLYGQIALFLILLCIKIALSSILLLPHLVRVAKYICTPCTRCIACISFCSSSLVITFFVWGIQGAT